MLYLVVLCKSISAALNLPSFQTVCRVCLVSSVDPAIFAAWLGLSSEEQILFLVWCFLNWWHVRDIQINKRAAFPMRVATRSKHSRKAHWILTFSCHPSHPLQTVGITVISSGGLLSQGQCKQTDIYETYGWTAALTVDSRTG